LPEQRKRHSFDLQTVFALLPEKRLQFRQLQRWLVAGLRLVEMRVRSPRKKNLPECKLSNIANFKMQFFLGFLTI